jgi:hypothetical protein
MIISRYFYVILENKHAEMTEVDRASTVLIIALIYAEPSYALAALKDGQYMKRKRVPIIAMSVE